MLNPELDVAALKQEYANDRRALIDNILSPAIAEEIHSALAELRSYDLLFFIEGANRAATPAQLDALTNDQRQQMYQQIYQLAGDGVGFLYCGYRMEGDKLVAAPQRLRELFEYVNGDEMLGFMREVTGMPELKGASGQYTRYEPGHFLTRHNDDVTAEGRQVAYVLNLSRQWHPDWGGLLQFYDQAGTVRDAWTPAFNRLALFDVRHVHSVTYVTPFARGPRLALTGWFNTGVS